MMWISTPRVEIIVHSTGLLADFRHFENRHWGQLPCRLQRIHHDYPVREPVSLGADSHAALPLRRP